MSSGEKKSQLAINETKQLVYEYKVLPPHVAPGFTEEYEEYFTNDRDQLRALTPEDCSIISARLLQYSIYIQRCYNRDKSRVTFLKSKISNAICKKAHKYSGQWDLQRQQAIKDSESATQMNSDLIEIEQRIERLDHISLSIKNMSDQYKSLQFSKIKSAETG